MGTRRARLVQVSVVACAGLALAAAGCKRSASPTGADPTTPRPGADPRAGAGVIETAAGSGGIVREAKTLDELPPELREQVMEASKEQAAAGADAHATLLRAWNYAPPPVLEASLHAKLVAAEVELDLPGTGFDLDDLDIVDAATGENYGSDPLLQRLTPRGEPVDFQDPAVVGEQHHLRLLAVWAVPVAVERIRLEYWGARLGGEIAVTGTRRELRVIEPSEAALGHGLAPATATGERSLYLLVECYCSRVAYPPSYQLVNGEDLIEEGRTVEVDAALAPVTTPLDKRPFYGRRTWVIEFRVPPGVEPREVNQFGRHTPLPGRMIVPGAALLSALGRLPLAR